MLARQRRIQYGAASDGQRIAQWRVAGGIGIVPRPLAKCFSVKRPKLDRLSGAVRIEHEQTGVNFPRRQRALIRGEELNLVGDRLECAISDEVFWGRFPVSIADRLSHAAGGVVNNCQGHALFLGSD